MEDTLSFFDCNVSLGAPAAGVYRPCTTPEELLAEMDWVGVDEALVYHALMREQSPVVGNRVLAESIAGRERLTGTWAILPPQTDELPPAPAFFQGMARARVRALWTFPEDHRYILGRITFGAFFDELAVRRIPLLVPRSVGWLQVYTLLAEYPDLTLIVTAHGPWGEDRYFRPLLEQYSRFHLDISRYELDCGIRDLVLKYGPYRLLYGSNFPDAGMGGPRLMVTLAEIDYKSRRAIAGGNLRRLLGEADLS